MLSTVTNVKLTPMTIGSLEPILQTGNSWISVAIPATSMAFCRRTATSAWESPPAAAMIVIGVRFDTNMARICWSPKGTAFKRGTLPSSLYMLLMLHSLFFILLSFPG